MSETIPQDIREKAEVVFEYWMKTADTVIADLISHLLLAHEREVIERCAKIADEWVGPEKLLPLCDNDMNEAARVGMNEAGERIATAIRETAR